MRLAKQHVDIGMFTADIAANRAFWGETVGLRLDMELPLRRGWVQHRFDAHDSVIKVNHYVDPLPQTPLTGYVGLTIARDGGPVWEGTSPEGNRVRLVPKGTDGVVGIGITVATPDPSRMMDFYVGAMEFERVAPQIARCGDTLLFVEQGPGGSETEDFIGAGGYRYLTVQIYDADKETDGIVARGGRLARAPENYGKIARVSFVKDPDGNWIEMSARASLTGVVPS
jgi:lactoylglutathione lyase